MLKRFLILAVASSLMGPALTSAYGNVLSLDDYNRFHEFDIKRTRILADEIGEFIINPPSPSGTSPEALRGSVRTQDCMIQLAGSFSMPVANLQLIGTLVGLASKMKDPADEFLLLKFINLHASAFPEQMKAYRRMLNATTRKCSSDGATAAKSQEVSRAYDDAAALVHSLSIKVKAVVP